MTSHPEPDRNHQFLFSLLDIRGIDSARKLTIRRVYDVCMHSLCLGDVNRARKAFGILLRCKEFDWKASWALAVYMLNAHDPDRDDTFFLSQVEQLRLLMLQDPTRREELLNEILQVLVQNGRYTEALDEIELYLPSFPYQDNPVLHIYAGLICLYMSQDPDSRRDEKSPDSLLEEAKIHLNRVITIDPGNCVAHMFLDQVHIPNACEPRDTD
ncbi:hypothetical protein BJ322DRAFT_1087533 [Thelephora terrestris]|uniref:Uncharacterized protein n=1 Tax=Thelephora terrestris TaxID=56493 RepID=A0A9P6L247_9AGAM|nr:hypothetical protein BJ322DRAFT_1087533 [Thelephora terrestris]